MTNITITVLSDNQIQISATHIKYGVFTRTIPIASFKRSGMNKFRELLQVISYETTLLLRETEK